jgi:hypothetical protein
MKNKNWIWFLVTLLAVAAAGVCMLVLRHSARHGSSVLNAPPPLESESAAQTSQVTTEPAVEASVPGALAVSSLRERCRAVLRLTAQEGASAYPVEEVVLTDGGEEGIRFVRTCRHAEGDDRYFTREGASYLLSDSLELLGSGAADTLLRVGERFTGDTVPAFVISSGGTFLRMAGDEFRSAGKDQATRWAEETETGCWYTVSGGRKRYLNADGLGDQGRTRWSVTEGVLRGDDPDGSFTLCFDGSWTLRAAGCFYLADAEGHCLNMDESGVLPDTEPHTLWSFDRDLYGLGGYFHTFLNGRRYALCLTDGGLALSTDPYAEYWLYQGGSAYLNRDGQLYCLNCRGGVWRAEPMTAWRIASAGSFLSAGDGDVTGQLMAGNATLWRIEEAGGGVVICTAEGEPQHLGYEENRLLLSTRLRTVWQQSGNALRSEGGGLCFRDGWRLGEADPLRFEQATLPMPVLTELAAGEAPEAALLPVEDMQLAERGAITEIPSGEVCCVPLCCDETLAASADNPGYLCPGETAMQFQSLENATFSTVLEEGQMQAMTRAAPDGTPRAARSDEGEFGLHCRRFLEQEPKNGVWGLRLSGEPRADGVTVMPLARFGGQSLRDCELVRGSIDLRLTASGTLSLFAAGSEGRFALYSVERDAVSGGITALRRINRIFLGEDSYIYDYAEGGLPIREDAELAFDTAWLGGDSKDVLYYYEIPLNAGEYALGAAGGDVMLLYLAVSEQTLGIAPEANAEAWDSLSDRALVSFLGDGANAEALGALLRADRAESLVDRVSRIADDARRDRAASLLEALSAAPETPDWRTLSDADFLQWLCDPANTAAVRALLEEDKSALTARAESLLSHEDYFQARERLLALS